MSTHPPQNLSVTEKLILAQALQRHGEDQEEALRTFWKASSNLRLPPKEESHKRPNSLFDLLQTRKKKKTEAVQLNELIEEFRDQKIAQLESSIESKKQLIEQLRVELKQLRTEPSFFEERQTPQEKDEQPKTKRFFYSITDNTIGDKLPKIRLKKQVIELDETLPTILPSLEKTKTSPRTKTQKTKKQITVVTTPPTKPEKRPTPQPKTSPVPNTPITTTSSSQRKSKQTKTKKVPPPPASGPPCQLTPEKEEDLQRVLRLVTQHKYAKPFKIPVSYADAPDYDLIVKHRIDLSAIKNNLSAGNIGSVAEFYRDLLLMCQNALVYNPVGSDMYTMTLTLKKFIKREMEKVYLHEKDQEKQEEVEKEQVVQSPEVDKENASKATTVTIATTPTTTAATANTGATTTTATTPTSTRPLRQRKQTKTYEF